MSIINKYHKPFEYAGIIMNLLLAYQFIDLWLYPEPSDLDKIYSLAVLMAFEFIMVHSGVFMAVFPKKTSLYIFVPIYGLFALAFNASMESNEILFIYLIVVINRMRFAFADVSVQIRNKAIVLSIIAALCYFILLVVCVLCDGVFGELGLTHEFLESISYFESIATGGEFTERPHTAISLGAFYYSILALTELLFLRMKMSGNPVAFHR